MNKNNIIISLCLTILTLVTNQYAVAGTTVQSLTTNAKSTGLESPYLARWIEKPEFFVAYIEETHPANWHYSDITILDEYAFYQIDIEIPTQTGKRVLLELMIPLAYVAEDKIEVYAEDIVSFDRTSNIVTYDLGKSVFKCQLMPKEEVK